MEYLDLLRTYYAGVQNFFQKCRSHLKIPGARTVTGVSIYNWAATATCHPRFVHPCHQILKWDSMKFVQSGQGYPYWYLKPEPPIYNAEVLITWLWQDPSNHWEPLTLPQVRRFFVKSPTCLTPRTLGDLICRLHEFILHAFSGNHQTWSLFLFLSLQDCL
jgi:hypothetical protein